MSDALKVRIGSVARAARERMGISQQELADRVGRDVDSISLIERGRTLPPLKTLLALVDALDVPLADFVPPSDRATTKSRKRVAVEAQIVDLVRQLPDSKLELVRDQILLIARHDDGSRKRR